MYTTLKIMAGTPLPVGPTQPGKPLEFTKDALKGNKRVSEMAGCRAKSWSKGGALIMELAQQIKRDGFYVEGRGSRRGYSVYDKKGPDGKLLYRLEYVREVNGRMVRAEKGAMQIRYIDLNTYDAQAAADEAKAEEEAEKAEQK